jgi:hypothetical protein
MAEKIFAEGLHYELPSQGAPDFVKGKLSVRVADFIEFLKAHVNERGFVNIDIKQSRGGNYYCELNEYRKAAQPRADDVDRRSPDTDYPMPEINPDDIPF